MLNAAHWRCFDSSSKNSSVNARGGAAMVGIAVFRRSGNVGNVRQPDPRSFFDRGSENRGTLEARRNVIHQPANLPSGLMVEPFLVEDRSWRLARSRRNAFHVFRSRFHVQEPRLAIGDWSGSREAVPRCCEFIRVPSPAGLEIHPEEESCLGYGRRPRQRSPVTYRSRYARN